MRYADDFVLMGERITEEILNKVKKLIENMGLKLNEEKTKLINAKENKFDFLGFTFRYDNCIFTKGNKYWNIIPSEKAEKKIKENLRELFRKKGHLCGGEITKEINSKIGGWVNYYKIEGISYPRKSQRKLRWYLMNKVYGFYKRKSQRSSKLYRKGAYRILVDKYGLIEPTAY